MVKPLPGLIKMGKKVVELWSLGGERWDGSAGPGFFAYVSKVLYQFPKKNWIFI